MPAPSSPPLIQRIVNSPTVRSAYASVVAHVIVLIAMALLLTTSPRSDLPRPLVIAMSVSPDSGEGDEGPLDLTLHDDQPAAAGGLAGEEQPPPVDAAHGDLAHLAPTPFDAPTAEPVADAILPLVPIPADAVGVEPRSAAVPARSASLARAAGNAAAAGESSPFAGRRPDARGLGARERGGSPASEAAVERGLAWLARHQAVDGSWRFDLAGCRCDGACRDPGSITSTTASTGIALLPFLGAGHTHLQGPYRETVNRGLYYLISRMQPTPRGGDLCEGMMYGHGTATLALAEALGMTRDDTLERTVRDAVRFIETAQDQYGGGWRYLPRQAGDTTVTAWQLAALKSAALAGIAVPSPTIDGASRFLDRVQSRGGEAYGYQGPNDTPCTSAIGLLCRMYLGWKDEEAIDRGLSALARPGPNPEAVYMNFYLSQALLQRDHELWPQWNAKNRDQLVAAQGTVGHEAGSWFFADRETAPGGRLAHTALAVLTLEVYYRLLPIYEPRAVEHGF